MVVKIEFIVLTLEVTIHKIAFTVYSGDVDPSIPMMLPPLCRR